MFPTTYFEPMYAFKGQLFINHFLSLLLFVMDQGVEILRMYRKLGYLLAWEQFILATVYFISSLFGAKINSPVPIVPWKT